MTFTNNKERGKDSRGTRAGEERVEGIHVGDRVREVGWEGRSEVGVEGDKEYR